MRISSFALTATLAMATFAAITPSEAQSRRGYGDAGYRYVTAESWYGAGTITAPVRFGPRGGREVRLPGGSWIDCSSSCSNTLRQETVDYWESRNGGGVPRDGVGYFRFRF